MKFVSPYNPDLLKKDAREASLTVFLCGPGYESAKYNFREKISLFLNEYPNIKTVLGEDLNPRKHRLKSGDLQTVETDYAHRVDFTILILESPGAIAELGTFSMIPNVRPRLFVMVPGKFFGSNSYIARGPLSAIGKEHVNNIIYFDETRQNESIQSLQMPVTLFKYAHTIDPFFRDISVGRFFRQDRDANYYVKAFEKIKPKFSELVVLISIMLMENPTFPMIISMTKMDPGDVQKALGRLFKNKSIARESGSRYMSGISACETDLAT